MDEHLCGFPRSAVPISFSPLFQYVYFFFHEQAAEVAPELQPSSYSRVARVCKKDMGVPHAHYRAEWSTFVKARLNCSVQERNRPFYFDELVCPKQQIRVPPLVELFVLLSARYSRSQYRHPLTATLFTRPSSPNSIFCAIPSSAHFGSNKLTNCSFADNISRLMRSIENGFVISG